MLTLNTENLLRGIIARRYLVFGPLLVDTFVLFAFFVMNFSILFFFNKAKTKTTGARPEEFSRSQLSIQ